MEWSAPLPERGKSQENVDSSVSVERPAMTKVAKSQSVAVVGIDLGKSSFQIFGVDQHGKPKLDRTCCRNQFKLFVAKLTPCLIGIEACAGAHFWARYLRDCGHEVKDHLINR